MPEPLIHFIVPFSVLIMCGIRVKKSAFFASLAILPDLDVLFHIHRSFSHSIFFILLFCAPAIIIATVKHSNMLYAVLIATLVILSHPFMDLFTYFTPIFWPLYDYSIYIIVELMTNMNNVSQLHLLFDIKLEPVVFYHTISMDAPIFTSQGIAATLVILIGLVLRYFFVRKVYEDTYSP
jgi:membrane-bound metal-dependent hydrolase YbcI (DUF457 family)